MLKYTTPKHLLRILVDCLFGHPVRLRLGDTGLETDYLKRVDCNSKAQPLLWRCSPFLVWAALFHISLSLSDCLDSSLYSTCKLLNLTNAITRRLSVQHTVPLRGCQQFPATTLQLLVEYTFFHNKNGSTSFQLSNLLLANSYSFLFVIYVF